MKPLHERFGDLKFEKGFKYGFLIGWVLMSILAIIILLSSPCHAQDSANNLHKWSINSLTISKSETVQEDTIQVTLLVRISGKPWAFFHDGWEVRKVTIDDGNRSQPGSMLLWHDASAVGKPIYSYLLYLDSRKRPIRKEWVVYDKYSRK